MCGKVADERLATDSSGRSIGSIRKIDWCDSDLVVMGHEQIFYRLGSFNRIDSFFHNNIVVLIQSGTAISAGFLAGLKYQLVKINKLCMGTIVGQILAMFSTVVTSCRTSVACFDAVVSVLPVGLAAVGLHVGALELVLGMILAGDFLRRLHLNVTDEYLILLETNVGRCCHWLPYGDVGLCVTGTFGIWCYERRRSRENLNGTWNARWPISKPCHIG